MIKRDKAEKSQRTGEKREKERGRDGQRRKEEQASWLSGIACWLTEKVGHALKIYIATTGLTYKRRTRSSHCSSAEIARDVSFQNVLYEFDQSTMWLTSCWRSPSGHAPIPHEMRRIMKIDGCRNYSSISIRKQSGTWTEKREMDPHKYLAAAIVLDGKMNFLVDHSGTGTVLTNGRAISVENIFRVICQNDRNRPIQFSWWNGLNDLPVKLQGNTKIVPDISTRFYYFLEKKKFLGWKKKNIVLHFE